MIMVGVCENVGGRKFPPPSREDENDFLLILGIFERRMM